jgi:hypothetical protein
VENVRKRKNDRLRIILSEKNARTFQPRLELVQSILQNVHLLIYFFNTKQSIFGLGLDDKDISNSLGNGRESLYRLQAGSYLVHEGFNQVHDSALGHI